MHYYVSATDDVLRGTHVNLGDFICQLSMKSFLRRHGAEVRYVRRDLVGKADLSGNTLVVSGYTSRAKGSVVPGATCRDVRYVGLHYGHDVNPGIYPAGYAGVVGCRDFRTFETLRNGNPGCHVSLCASLLVNEFVEFPELDVRRDKTILVDVPDWFRAPVGPDVVTFTHYVPHCWRSEDDLLRAALRRLTYYKERGRKVITGRLHAYLPCVAMGVPCEYVGPRDSRTEIADVVTENTIARLQPLVAQDFRHIVFGLGPDVHEELHSLCMELRRRARP